jgi:hypothetical protein
MTDCFRSFGWSNWSLATSAAHWPALCTNAVSYQSALKVNRLPCRCRKLQTRRILKLPADLLLGVIGVGKCSYEHNGVKTQVLYFDIRFQRCRERCGYAWFL